MELDRVEAIFQLYVRTRLPETIRLNADHAGDTFAGGPGYVCECKKKNYKLYLYGCLYCVTSQPNKKKGNKKIQTNIHI